MASVHALPAPPFPLALAADRHLFFTSPDWSSGTRPVTVLPSHSPAGGPPPPRLVWALLGHSPRPFSQLLWRTPPRAATLASMPTCRPSAAGTAPRSPTRMSSCPHTFAWRPQAAEHARSERRAIPGFPAQRGPPVPPTSQNTMVRDALILPRGQRPHTPYLQPPRTTPHLLPPGRRQGPPKALPAPHPGRPPLPTLQRGLH